MQCATDLTGIGGARPSWVFHSDGAGCRGLAARPTTSVCLSCASPATCLGEAKRRRKPAGRRRKLVEGRSPGPCVSSPHSGGNRLQQSNQPPALPGDFLAPSMLNRIGIPQQCWGLTIDALTPGTDATPGARPGKILIDPCYSTKQHFATKHESGQNDKT